MFKKIAYWFLYVFGFLVIISGGIAHAKDLIPGLLGFFILVLGLVIAGIGAYELKKQKEIAFARKAEEKEAANRKYRVGSVL